MHSTRIAAVCYLWRAGLTDTVVKALADWTSDQVRRYGHRLILDPELVEPWAFYNPESGSYVDVSSYAPPAKRRGRGGASPSNVPCADGPNPNPSLGLVSGAGTGKPRRGRPAGSGVGAAGRVPESANAACARARGRPPKTRAAR